jgi:hypothetical protein
MTILERIKNNTDGVLDNPSLLSEYLVILASNIGEADKQKVIAEVEYAKKWSEIRKTTESDKAADMKMKLELEYIELRSKESLVKVLLETIRSVKKRLAFLATEYKELT